MKNIHIIATEKPSRLHLAYDKDYYLSVEHFIQSDTKNYKSFNIYITSDEKTAPGKGDWYLGHPLYTSIHRWHTDVSKIDGRDVWINKIILTTDQDLINDGVQAIDDEFLEWFVKNPSCESVEVEIETTSIQLPQQQLSENSYDLAFRWINKKVYKIIIPKEEPKQETVEEAIKKEYETRKFNSDFPFDPQSFKLGTKWQQERMYSEEEVLDLLYKRDLYLLNRDEEVELELPDEWFERFKKK